MAANFGPSRVQVGRYEDPFSGGVKALDSIQKQVNVYDAQKAVEERNKLLDARYNKEQAYKDSERKRIADERAKALATEEAVRRIDTGYDISADRRIAGVEDEILSRPELIGSVLSDKEGGSAEQRAQHKKFTEETLAKYDEVGLMDKADAHKEAYNAYIRAGASRADAQVGADQKVAGMQTKAEKQAAKQAIYDRNYEDQVAAHTQRWDEIKSRNANVAKVQAAVAKKHGKFSGDNTKAAGTISTILSKNNITGDETGEFYDMLNDFKSKGYTDKQIAAVLPATTEEGYSMFGIGNIYDPQVGKEALASALAASFPKGIDGKPSSTAATGGGSYAAREAALKMDPYPTRARAVADKQRTSDELRKEFVAKMDGTYKPSGTGVKHPGGKAAKATAEEEKEFLANKLYKINKANEDYITKQNAELERRRSTQIPRGEIQRGQVPEVDDIVPTRVAGFTPTQDLGGVPGAQTLSDVAASYGSGRPDIAPVDRTTEEAIAARELATKLRDITGNAEPTLEENMFMSGVKDPTEYIETVDRVRSSGAPIEAKRAELRSLGFPASLIQKILR